MNKEWKNVFKLESIKGEDKTNRFLVTYQISQDDFDG